MQQSLKHFYYKTLGLKMAENITYLTNDLRLVFLSKHSRNIYHRFFNTIITTDEFLLFKIERFCLSDEQARNLCLLQSLKQLDQNFYKTKKKTYRK